MTTEGFWFNCIGLQLKKSAEFGAYSQGNSQICAKSAQKAVLFTQNHSKSAKVSFLQVISFGVENAVNRRYFLFL